jgi:hypothetical protein
MRATWKPHEKSGRLTRQSDLPDSVYAFPKQRKEPLTDAKHVRNAIARLDQVEGVSDAERELAFANIRKAAAHYGIELSETSAADAGVHPQSAANKRKRTAARARTAKKSTAKKSPAKKTAAKKSSAKKRS